MKGVTQRKVTVKVTPGGSRPDLVSRGEPVVLAVVTVKLNAEPKSTVVLERLTVGAFGYHSRAVWLISEGVL